MLFEYLDFDTSAIVEHLLKKSIYYDFILCYSVSNETTNIVQILKSYFYKKLLLFMLCVKYEKFTLKLQKIT